MLTKEEAEKAYQDLIQLRRSEVLVKSKDNVGSIEIHHIVLKSCGGTDDESNLIALYAKEHFMAHVYLWLIHHDDKFHDQTTAALRMFCKGTINGYRKELRDFILESEEYQKAREEFAQYCSQNIPDKIKGENNGAYGKHWYKDPNSQQYGLFNDDEQPNGWVKGKYQKQNNNSSSNAGKVLIRKKDLSEQKYVSKDEAQKLIESGEWEHKALPFSEQGLKNIRESNRKCREYTVYATGLAPSNKFKTKCINKTTNEILYIDKNSIIPDGFAIAKNNTICCINTIDKTRIYIYKDNPVPDGYVLSTFLNKKIQKKSKQILKEEYIEETQEMADYFTKYGYEETCKKFPCRSGICSIATMLMRFINARKKYGIKFETYGGKNMKKRIFKKV